MTVKVWVAVVLSVGSVAVTVIVAVSPALAEVVSMCRTPLGFCEESVAQVIVTGVIGCELALRIIRTGSTATLDRSVTVFCAGDQLAEDREVVVEGLLDLD